MPASQLKRLRASLRENGVTGPQQSKKQKKQQRNGRNDHGLQRNAAPANIRESLNPFETKTLARPRKFDVTSNKTIGGNLGNGVVGRPGVTKSLGEEARRRTLLPELHRRNKAGGILDQRIGENDPMMTPEERMLQRYAREKQRKKGASLFDLEDEDEEEQLTHMGRSLAFGAEDQEVDDFEAGSLEQSSDEEDNVTRPSKRKRVSEGSEEGPDNAAQEEPERKKTKAEVMKEVVAKSKLHKYERQQAKEEDDDLRDELDRGLPDILAALRGHKAPKPTPASANASSKKDFSINPGRAALLDGMDRATADKEYDARLRQMALDKRAAPTERTKTEAEKAAEEADRLKELEEKRQRRMRGEESEEDEPTPQTDGVDEEKDLVGDDAAEFGFGSTKVGLRPPGVDDEDDFLIEDYLTGDETNTDAEVFTEDDDTASSVDTEEDDDFGASLADMDDLPDGKGANTTDLAFTYPCPQNHAELIAVMKDVPMEDVPKVIQRVRALYHPQLSQGSKQKLENFAVALVDHISYLAKPTTPLTVIETVIRHIHSLSRTYPEAIANVFRAHLRTFHNTNSPSPGVLVVLTAIGSIYPTSDHFHQVVTPAITLMARWLGMTTPQGLQDLVTGAFLGKLCLQYQTLSKRYIPELLRFTLLALKSGCPPDILDAHVGNLLTMADHWASKAAFIEVFTPDALKILSSLNQTKAVRRLQILLDQARLARRPLELHHHRPLAIKTAIPKFEEGFNPDKYYDPDRERAEASKLRAEYKRERKGALRELRKDASFIAREQLKEKRERDKAHAERERRLIAEIQGEEGAERNAYEREKRTRKGRK